MLRAWLTAEDDERMKVKVPPFGGFESWSYRIREPLVWLGEADPCDTVKMVRERDPIREILVLVLAQCHSRLPIAPTFGPAPQFACVGFCLGLRELRARASTRFGSSALCRRKFSARGLVSHYAD